MSVMTIRGGHPLLGVFHVHGAKNSVLPILAATLLNSGISVIHNCPDLRDVSASLDILRHLGCTARKDGGTITVDSTVITRCDIPDHLMREMRSSIIFLGAILARCGEAEMSFPGGCELGQRPIDLHLGALRRMGATIRDDSGRIRCRAKKLRGCKIALSLPSVGATENILLAACAAEGETVICNAAREPEVADLQRFINAMGGCVEGIGSSEVIIGNCRAYHPAEHTVIGDRIVTATMLAAVAAAGGDVILTGIDPSLLVVICDIFREAGCELAVNPQGAHIRVNQRLRSVCPVRTQPYPGFPTDAQAPLMAAAVTFEGTTVFIENMFENRFRHVDGLTRMGADIRVEGRVAVVCGVPRLSGAPVEMPDLRAGAALVAAALGAEGETRITGLEHIDRGYQGFAEALRSLGADVFRE